MRTGLPTQGRYANPQRWCARGRTTQRQLSLYYREAIRAKNEAQAARIVAVNLGFAGGSAAKEALAKLTGCRRHSPGRKMMK